MPSDGPGQFVLGRSFCDSDRVTGGPRDRATAAVIRHFVVGCGSEARQKVYSSVLIFASKFQAEQARESRTFDLELVSNARFVALRWDAGGRCSGDGAGWGRDGAGVAPYRED